MKPRDAIRNALEQYVEPRLVRMNFRFLPGSLAFVRKDGVFTQRIDTQLKRWNMEDVLASFDITASVRSSYYGKWHFKEFGQKPVNDYLVSEFFLNLKGWQHGSPDVSKSENAEMEMLNLTEDILAAAIPFLEHNSDWKNAAHTLLAKKWFYDKACDFCLIAGETEVAHMCLTKALETWTMQPNRTFFVGEKEAVQLRFRKYFGQSIVI